ncbi:MAG: HD domain-containing protein, partial [Deferribacterales bacterium]
IKEKYPDKSVIIITGFPSLETAILSLSLGADDYITKPFNVNEVQNKIYKAIDTIKLKTEIARLNDIISIYESSKFLSSTLSQEEITLEIYQKIIGEWGFSGFYIKLFTPHISFQTAETSFIDYIDNKINAKKAYILFKNKKIHELTIEINNKKIQSIILPMYNEKGLMGIFAIYNDTKKKLTNIKKHLINIYVNQVSLAIQNSLSYLNISEGYLQTILALSNAVDAKDSYTRGHSENVKKYSLMIVEEMGFNSDFARCMTYAGLLHDIGKIGIDTYIIVKPDRLTPQEFEEIKKHPEYGKEILEPIKFLGDVPYYVLFHHEKLDGTGYPFGLTDQEIPIGAKILSVADSYDAMTTDRSYRPRRTPQLAVEELERCIGTQFDKDVVTAFKSALKRYGYI